MMKIDYELADKIGATHYSEGGDFYKVHEGILLCYSIEKKWNQSILSSASIVKCVKPIPPKQKPPVRVEYERAKYSRVSDAIAAHESGVKFKRELPDGDFTDYLSWFELCECYANNYKIVVEIEKPVDERQEFIETCMKNTNLRARDGATEVFGSLYVAGCRFLQE